MRGPAECSVQSNFNQTRGQVDQAVAIAVATAITEFLANTREYSGFNCRCSAGKTKLSQIRTGRERAQPNNIGKPAPTPAASKRENNNKNNKNNNNGHCDRADKRERRQNKEAGEQRHTAQQKEQSQVWRSGEKENEKKQGTDTKQVGRSRSIDTDTENTGAASTHSIQEEHHSAGEGEESN